MPPALLLPPVPPTSDFSGFRDAIPPWEAQPVGCSQLVKREHLKLGGERSGPLATARTPRALRGPALASRLEPAWGAR